MADLKKILTLVSVFSIACVAVIIVLSVLLGTKSPSQKENVCTTKSCISAANLILNNIDSSIDPCEDFNKFSCGNFIRTRRIPDDSSSTDTFTDLRTNLALALSDSLSEDFNSADTEATKNAKRYYRSCLNENKLETDGEANLKQIVNNDLGGCSLVDNNYQLNAESSFDKLVKFAKMGLKPLFDVYISSNPKNPESYVIRLQQSNWYLSKSIYQNLTNNVRIESYKKLMKNIFNYMNPNVQDLDNKVEKMFNLERNMALSTLDSEQRRNQTYTNMTINDLDSYFPNFDWKRYILNELFSDFPELNLSKDETILVVDISYIKSVVDLFNQGAQNDKDTLHNLLIWSFVKSRTNFLPKKYRDAQLDFDKIYSGTNTIPPRYRTCANAIADRMPYAVGRLYVSKNFDEASKKAATEMIENIRKEFKIMLDENEWMDQVSKKSAREKADFIDTKIGYPDYTYNNTYLDSLYENYAFNEANYLANSLLVTKQDMRKSFAELRKKRDTKDWITGPAIVNAFYSSTNNQISFPAGILQAPFYDSKFPNYLNYGGIGSVIGHEITHGFDDQGRRYDKNGVFFPDGEVGLWTDQTIDRYKQKAKCIIDQYSGYKAEQVNKYLGGFQTQGENIADNGGVKESFRAYRRWAEKNGPEPLLPGLNYNQEQLFFINYAQVWCIKITNQALEQRIETGVHSPGEFRIIGPTSNLEFFSKAFNCKRGQNNNPEKKCSVW